jgi:SAM-dependent methyltransferase
VNADILPYINADVVMDLNEEWPWPDNAFDQVWANHVLEHGWDKLHMISELWRVCKPGAYAQIRLPVYSWTQFWDDPTHRSCWSVGSMNSFNVDHPEHGALTFKDGPAFKLLHDTPQVLGGYVIAWDMEAVKQPSADLAEPSIEAPQEGAKL